MAIFESVELLKKYFETTPREELEAGWKVVDELDLGGPSVEDLELQFCGRTEISGSDWTEVPSCDVVVCDDQQMVTTTNKNYSLAA